MKNFHCFARLFPMIGLVVSCHFLFAQNVGIATTTPVEKLQIGDFDHAADTYLGIKTVGGNQFKAGIKLRHFNEGFGWTILSNEVQTKFQIIRHMNDINGDTVISINGFNGNVGIGTNDPQSLLHIMGRTIIGEREFNDNAILQTWNKNYNGPAFASIGYNPDWAGAAAQFWTRGKGAVANFDWAGTETNKLITFRNYGNVIGAIKTDGGAWFSGSVGIGLDEPNQSALLDVSSSTKGVLIPRMTIEERNAIIDPAKGLMVFVNTDSSFHYFAGTSWIRILPESENWLLTGNANATDKRLGTLDTSALRLVTRDIERVTIDSNGFIGINNTSPKVGLHMVDNGSGFTDLNIEYNRNDGYIPAIELSKSKGTYDEKLPIDSGQTVGIVSYSGYSSDNLYLPVGAIQAITRSDLSLQDFRGDLLFSAYNRTNNVNEHASMSFTHKGRLGIGVPEPEDKLYAKSNIDDRITMESTQIGYAGFRSKTPDAEFFAGINLGRYTIFDNKANEFRLTIDNAGNVGIGKFDPAAKLDVDHSMRVMGTYGGFSVHPYFTPGLSTALLASFDGLDNGPQMRFESTAPGFTDIGLNGAGDFVVESNDNPELVVTNAGKVGVGTSNPVAKLDIAGSIKITDGTQGAGKVLTSDANGLAQWSGLPRVEAGSYETTWVTVGGFSSAPSTRNCEYSRVGNTVTVVCRFGGTGPTFSAGVNSASITLPPGLEVADPFGGRLISGIFSSDHYRNGVSDVVGIVAHNSNNSVLLRINNSPAGIAGSWCSFTYQTINP